MRKEKKPETACLYLRYSSASQTEQSIEGQMRVCQDYCERNHIIITDTYIDRAKSASHGIVKRTEFLRMIADAEKANWDAVIVYKLDRFARNRYDSATYKAKLKKHGKKLISATETLSDTPESIILESVLEGMAEFYSAELSQKIKRGITESAHKHMSVGGATPLGYKIIDKHFAIDESTVAIVREAFNRYADGEPIIDIAKSFNDRGYRSSKGAKFSKSSFHRMFKNKRYIGYYICGDYEAPDAIPAIIDLETWDRVQMRIEQTRYAPARMKASEPYLLSGKLICGHCGCKMLGESGTGKNGELYRYYTCDSRKRHKGCRKKPVPKHWIEDIVVDMAKDLLKDEDVIHQMAEMAVAENERILAENGEIHTLESRIAEIEKGINNISKVIESTGIAPETLVNRLTELEKERVLTHKALADAEKNQVRLTVPQVEFWLTKFTSGDYDDETFRRQLVDMLINSVVIWDDDGDDDHFKLTVAYNLDNKKSKTINVSDFKCSDLNPIVEHCTSNPNKIVILQTRYVYK